MGKIIAITFCLLGDFVHCKYHIPLCGLMYLESGFLFDFMKCLLGILARSFLIAIGTIY